MRTSHLAWLISALASSFASAADGVEGTFGLGGLITHTDATSDRAKLTEYRDLNSGVLANFELHRRGAQYIVVLGERLGRDDQSLSLEGGRDSLFAYRLFDDRIVHNESFGARTPYTGIGSTELTASLPNLDTSTWNRFDVRLQREHSGGAFEWSGAAPWFVRAEFDRVEREGLQLIADSNGTSPTNGFTDKPIPIDSVTRNVRIESGYASPQAHVLMTATRSWFANSAERVRWQNAFFAGSDESFLAPDNTHTAWSLSGALRRLPLHSSLSGRMSYARTTSVEPIAAQILSTGGIAPTAPSRDTFDGKAIRRQASLSLASAPMPKLDAQLQWSHASRGNRSSDLSFAPAPNSGLQCGAGPCRPRRAGYDSDRFAVDARYRINSAHRIGFMYDHSDMERERVDYDRTRDSRVGMDYRNASFDAFDAYIKYQHLRRRSHFMNATAGNNANDPEYLNRFVKRFDAANVDQDSVNLRFDIASNESFDIGLEAIVKRNRFLDTLLGRTRDLRRELYASLGFGDADTLRHVVFVDIEDIRYDSVHRNITAVSTGTGVGANAPPSGYCQTTSPNCFDPYTAPSSANYNWSARNGDRNYAAGISSDWRVNTRWRIGSSLVWEQTRGTVDFAVQSGANPAVPAVDIDNYDNTRKLALNLRGDYSLSTAWSIAGGYAYERFRFDDIQYNDYRYTIGSGPSASYLTGAYAFPEYAAHLLHVVITYSF